ncbi:hypothetical protein SJ05684_b55160 (plasmid) [Sinorhizobium sojae CCBAU 05684]|uniref:Uncharacterized protein n=1 Tax=Sinorhizobium sojae CCBAU 05684 TaxID=716928 RepID=A0A249PKP2_9HYPH|nr:hypothetical protein SJ05684_b55160 [Sinorhizobium sojae CCBAU 05684]
MSSIFLVPISWSIMDLDGHQCSRFTRRRKRNAGAVHTFMGACSETPAF